MSLPIDHPYITTGDGAPVAEAWRFDGFDDGNTDRGRLHVTTVVVGAELRFDCYKDRDKTALVCQGAAAIGARAVLADQNNSGISGSVMVVTVAPDTRLTVYLALATDIDIEKRDDRIRGLLGEEPAECDFRAVWELVIREFYLRIQSDIPPPAFVGDPLRFPGTSSQQTPGASGLADVRGIDIWHLNGEGDWEIKGLENVKDWRTWAVEYSLWLIWDRKARDGEDTLVARADRYLDDSKQSWQRVPYMIDSDRDEVADRPLEIRSLTLERG